MNTADLKPDFERVLTEMKESLANVTPEQKAEREKACQVQDERLRRQEIDSQRLRWNAPKRQALTPSTKLGDCNPWMGALRRLSSWRGTGFTAALAGGRGNGKTQMGVSLMKESTHHLKTAYYMTAIEFYQRIRHTYSHQEGGESEADIMRELRSYKLLVLDECNKRSENRWENLLFFELLDKRYQDMSDTLLIANQEPDAFSESMGQSVVSRINETGGLIVCSWPSFR